MIGGSFSVVGAHPRVCGENWNDPGSAFAFAGSSPRVRGKRIEDECKKRWGGLIPACAGKTPVWRRAEVSNGAHPRVCGENLGKMFFQIAASGSSPRVRGKLARHVYRPHTAGLIPACAGKTIAGSP